MAPNLHPKTSMRRSRVPTSKGFTLLETMIVVLIIGILAALAVYGVRKYVLSAKSAEARQMILSIKAAEETYREETYIFKSANGDAFANNSRLFPQSCKGTTPGKVKYAWEQPDSCADALAWRELGVTSTNPVQYGYGVQYVAAKGAMPAAGHFDWTNVPNTHGPAFAVIAKGDLTGDGNFSLFVGSNFTDQIYVENEDE